MNRKNGLLAGILVLLCIAAGVLYTQFKPETTTETKQLSVLVTHGDGQQNTHVYETKAEYLGEVLRTDGLISGEEGPYGLFILTVDGETADENKQQWWNITKDGEAVTFGVDELPIADGDTFELTLTEGY